jgi:pyruvate dehydrogenase E2 component (dihydrolipoamide acetyltransferase)
VTDELGAIPLLLPALSDGMEFGTILAWLKQPGDEVHLGEDIVEVELDKATVVWQSEHSGFLRPVATAGSNVAVGDLIATLHASAADALNAVPGAPPPAATAPVSVPVPAAGSIAAPVRASPLARRRARALALDLATIRGSARDGGVVSADLGATAEQSIKAIAPVPASSADQNAPEHIELTRMQRAIATAMTEAKATIPDFAVVAEVDLEAALALRDVLRDAGEVMPSINDLVIRAVALSLREHPKVNSRYRNGAVERYRHVNVGFAVAAGDGLVVPRVLDADHRSLLELATETRTLADRVREATITPAELDGGTFTVSNLGMYGVTRIFPIIHAGQAGILGVGSTIARVVPIEGGTATHRIIELTLTGDHRVLNGVDAATFLASVRRRLEHPVSLLT